MDSETTANIVHNMRYKGFHVPGCDTKLSCMTVSTEIKKRKADKLDVLDLPNCSKRVGLRWGDGDRQTDSY
jgi:hypothetical protein